jgi:hypothetical protein
MVQRTVEHRGALIATVPASSEADRRDPRQFGTLTWAMAGHEDCNPNPGSGRALTPQRVRPIGHSVRVHECGWLRREKRRVDDQQRRIAREVTGEDVEFTIAATMGTGTLDWVGLPSLVQRHRVLAFTADSVIVVASRWTVGRSKVTQRADRDAIVAARLSRLYGRVEVDGEAYFVHRRWFDDVRRAMPHGAPNC